MNKLNPPKITRKSIPKRKIIQISSFEISNSEHSQSIVHWQIRDIIEVLQPQFSSVSFASLLTVKDVIAMSSVCKGFRKIFNKNYLRLVIQLGNMNADIRYLFWIHKAPYAR